MTRPSRLFLAIASVLLLAVFVVPLWRIDLIAPQYPEGLGMLIRINTVTGIKPNDLANINGLNHYIGMKAIEPDAIPELRLMPWIVAGLATLGMLGAVFGSRRVLYGWLGGFATLAVVGLIDFWRWEYDYGHNIDFEHAIIKVPGMTYQPPLIGTKQLLNFTASSWPALGAVCLGLAFVLGVAALLIARRSRAATRTASIALTAAATACSTSGPRAIAYNHDACDYCHMTISDERFGGQVVTAKGKIYAFDSIDCLASFCLANRAPMARAHIYVADYAHPGQWLVAEDATYATTPARNGPMGIGIVSFDAGADTATIRRDFDSAIIRWTDVLELVRHEPIAERADATSYLAARRGRPAHVRSVGSLGFAHRRPPARDVRCAAGCGRFTGRPRTHGRRGGSDRARGRANRRPRGSLS